MTSCCYKTSWYGYLSILKKQNKNNKNFTFPKDSILKDMGNNVQGVCVCVCETYNLPSYWIMGLSYIHGNPQPIKLKKSKIILASWLNPFPYMFELEWFLLYPPFSYF